MNRPTRWGMLLLAASLFFGWETYHAWTSPVDPGASPAAPFSPREWQDGSRENDPRGAAVAAEVAAILAKPVFRPDRRPFQDNASGGGSVRNYQAELSRLSLVGVIFQGDRKTAVIVGGTSGRTERWEVGPGDALPGFTVGTVEEEGVRLAADGREFLLPMYTGPPEVKGSGPLRTEVSTPTTASPGAIRMQPAGSAGPSPRPPTIPPVSMQPPAPPAAEASSATPVGIRRDGIPERKMRRTIRGSSR